MEVELVGLDGVPRRAAQFGGDLFATVAVSQLNRSAAVIEPAIAPLHEGYERGQEIGALVGQPVTLTRTLAWLAVVLSLEQPVSDQLPQPGRHHGLARPDSFDEVVKPLGSVERLPEYEKGRARGDYLESSGDHAPIGAPAAAGFQ